MKNLLKANEDGRVCASRLATKNNVTRPLGLVLSFFCAAAFLASCATKPVKKAGPTFFPPPPDEPRIQFLTAFSTDTDLNWNVSKFAEFVTGKAAPQNPLVK